MKGFCLWGAQSPCYRFLVLIDRSLKANSAGDGRKNYGTKSLRKGKRKNRSCELKSQNVEEKEEVGGCTHVKRSGGCIHVKRSGGASML